MCWWGRQRYRDGSPSPLPATPLWTALNFAESRTQTAFSGITCGHKSALLHPRLGEMLVHPLAQACHSAMRPQSAPERSYVSEARPPGRAGGALSARLIKVSGPNFVGRKPLGSGREKLCNCAEERQETTTRQLTPPRTSRLQGQEAALQGNGGTRRLY